MIKKLSFSKEIITLAIGIILPSLYQRSFALELENDLFAVAEDQEGAWYKNITKIISASN